MSRTLKVGFIGTGGISNTHMPGWKDGPHTEVVAGCDVNEENLKTWGKRHDVEQLYTDPGQMFADADIDIVDICTPNMYHKPLVIGALQAGKHVLCEKPLAPTPEDIREMIAARDASGKLLMTAQHLRFSSVNRNVKAEIDAGSLGEIYHARSWMLRRAALPTKPTFIQKLHAGGGPCIDIGVHILDLTLWMMGHPKPVSVTGVARRELADREGAWSIWGGSVPKEIDVEDFASAFVRFDNGATLILEVSWMLHHNTNGSAEDRQMWLYGNKGGLHWPSCVLHTTNNDTRQFYDTHFEGVNSKTKPHAAECMAFTQAILDDAPSPVPAEQSLDVQTILHALYASQETGREVRLDDGQ